MHDFVVHYLRQLAEAGFTVMFVSNAPRLCAATVRRLRPHCGLILRRANVGYDFGAYKEGVAEVPDLRRLERLLLANDSAYGPFQPLKDIIDRMDGSAEIWGIITTCRAISCCLGAPLCSRRVSRDSGPDFAT